LTFKDRQLRKFFKTGDHVKVIAGKHEGATGMIVKIQNDVITLLSDTTREDIDVFSSNIVESSEITSGITKLGDYELHDLVALDQSTVGVIVRVEKDGFQVYQLCLDAEFVVWTVFMCCDFCLICSYTIVVTRPCMVGR
jgi:transcription elongation factor SPT5